METKTSKLFISPMTTDYTTLLPAKLNPRIFALAYYNLS